ncbi:NACHT domain-containing protein, partial [Xanthobacter flavus]|uniref:NACHT domain-containing protein n=1 Tax=Xanthobacter flavus TaxID=281 RepID=UPI00372B712A
MTRNPTPTPASPNVQGTSTAQREVYFPRQLTLAETSTPDNEFDEAGLLALTGNKVVLGEPGMGKSALMRELGRRLEVKPITAIRFIGAKNPAKLVPDGKPLLIDGLDEAMSRREGDAIDSILAQLEHVGSPPFILSCRSREWQARGATNLADLYGADPQVLTLAPFDRADARAYLLARHPSSDADHVLDHLSANSLEDLYRNPLTLGLLGRVTESDTALPLTRAALFEQVCTLVWPEHDSDRENEGLSQLTEDEALDAAGAIAAGLLFAGAEAASAMGAAHVQKGDLRLADIEKLPKAKGARALFSSKLFHSVGRKRAKPIHRVIAEFLGARWIARQTTAPRLQRRLLAQLHGSGGVPASL